MTSTSIIFATGYDAVTGSLTRIDIRGEGGLSLKEKFAGGPRTYMGIQSVGFPNLFTINAASVGNFVRAAEPLVEWVTDCIGYLRDNGYVRIAPTIEAEEEWGAARQRGGRKKYCGARRTPGSWVRTFPAKPAPCLPAPDSAPAMRAKRAEVKANGYEGFALG